MFVSLFIYFWYYTIRNVRFSLICGTGIVFLYFHVKAKKQKQKQKNQATKKTKKKNKKTKQTKLLKIWAFSPKNFKKAQATECFESLGIHTCQPKIQHRKLSNFHTEIVKTDISVKSVSGSTNIQTHHLQLPAFVGELFGEE